MGVRRTRNRSSPANSAPRIRCIGIACLTSTSPSGPGTRGRNRSRRCTATRTWPVSAAWRVARSVFASLASLWAHARDAEAEREKEAGELFRARTRPPGALETLEGDDPKTEEAAYRRAFGDFGAAFRDLQAPPGEQAPLGDDEKDEEAEEDEDAADALDPAAVHAAKVAGLLEGELLDEVVAAHRRVLSALAGPPKPPDSGKLPSSGGGEKANASVYSEDAFSSVGVRLAMIGAPSKYGAALTPEEADSRNSTDCASGSRLKVSSGSHPRAFRPGVSIMVRPWRSRG
mgnify:CR=1 FL=1